MRSRDINSFYQAHYLGFVAAATLLEKLLAVVSKCCMKRWALWLVLVNVSVSALLVVREERYYWPDLKVYEPLEEKTRHSVRQQQPQDAGNWGNPDFICY
jgi:hypothetical protein